MNYPTEIAEIVVKEPHDQAFHNFVVNLLTMQIT